MGIAAGRLRHRIEIQRKAETQDATTGDVRPPTYVTIAQSVPAEWVPLSVTEFIASASMQSQITARVTIRPMKGLRPDMRILYRGVYYDPHGFLADKVSGKEYITIPVSQSIDQTP